ncbi:MAG TPA: hypothetical protein VGI81_06405 [Tepidisphaeraceae bacterium]
MISQPGGALKDPVLLPETDSEPAEYDVGPDVKLPPFDRYVTWSEPSGSDNDVEYFWDGQAVGKGEAGVHALVKKLDDTPAGSKVLFYPDFRVGPTGGGLFFVPPYYGEAEAELRAAARRQHLVIIYSQRDRFGMLIAKPR